MRNLRVQLLLSLCLLVTPAHPVFAQFDPNKVQDEAFQAMKDKQWPTAAERFKQLADFKPTEPLFQVNLAFTLMQSGQAADAIPHLLRAIELSPDLETAWMNLGRAYQMTNQVDKEIEALEKFASLTTNPESKRNALALAASTKEAMAKRIIDDSPNDYFKTITANGNRERWIAERQPVKVYIDEHPKLDRYQPEFAEAVQQTFAEWSAATGDKVKFEFVKNKSDAAIDVGWVSSQDELKDPGEAGECLKLNDGKGINSAHVKIGLFSPELSREYIHCLSLHEVGHAIGIAGHSWVPEDIMYIAPAAAVRKSTGLTARDKETARRFYNEEIGESWLALNNRGMELENKKDFEGALECYLKALKISDEKTVHGNLAALHFNWAQHLWQDGQFGTAESHYKTAWDMESQRPDGNYDLMRKGYAKFLRAQKRDNDADALEKQRAN